MAVAKSHSDPSKCPITQVLSGTTRESRQVKNHTIMSKHLPQAMIVQTLYYKHMWLAVYTCMFATQPFAEASFPRIFSVACQKGATVAISTLSSGLWAPLMVGPYDTASMPGTFSRMIPHSRPAWIAPTCTYAQMHWRQCLHAAQSKAARCSAAGKQAADM